MKTLHCKHCQSPFLQTREWSEFCSSKCRMAWHSNRRATGGQAALELVDLRVQLADARNKIADLEEKLLELRVDARELAQRLRKYEPEPTPCDTSVRYIPQPAGSKHRTPPQPIKVKPFLPI